ncbi:YybH family protein [Streptomyces iconiensis]|uniref:DUF4440 domain-containing protein n=1 Tax=Streptomyces iconiensis TaxID=1384038 RepID=A0ABT6ZQJ7_9ACTN|nr:nuclear transport factor 2 family protein [Streptomyces iconiensis]MDJ1131329.1 DUF4440 domain-containing protein [Streptomyces iconiensis]
MPTHTPHTPEPHIPEPHTPAAHTPQPAGEAGVVWSLLTGMYAAYETGDREAIDACLDPEATIWDSAVPGLLRGRADLERVRAARPAPVPGGAPAETGVTAYDPVAEVFGDTAVLRYWLRVEFGPGRFSPELVRNTAVLRRSGTGHWRIVHLHEDVAQAGGEPLPS